MTTKKEEIAILLKSLPGATYEAIAELSCCTRQYVEKVARAVGDSGVDRCILHRRRRLWSQGVGLCSTCGKEKPALEMSKHSRRYPISVRCKECNAAKTNSILHRKGLVSGYYQVGRGARKYQLPPGVEGR